MTEERSMVHSGPGAASLAAVPSSATMMEPTARRRVRRDRAKKIRATAVAYLFLLPAATILFVFHIYPVLYAGWLSLYKWNMISPNREWLGLQNYVDLFRDPLFLKSLWNTVYYVVGSVPTGMILALAIAVLLNTKIRGLGIYRTIYFLPVVTAINAVAIIWMWIYAPDAYGLLNGVLGWFGISPKQWLLTPELVMPALIIMSVWKGLGYNVVIFLAGLQNIAPEYYEAAAIDGANAWKRFRHITLPLLSPTTFFILIISIIGSFQVFSQVYIMFPDGGGPLNSALVVVLYLFQNAFIYYQMGYAAAMAYVLFFIIFALTMLQRYALGGRIHYD